MPESDEVTRTLDRAQVYKKLHCLVQAIPGIDEAADINEMTLIADLEMDSLRLVEIIFELECHFDVVADEGAMVEARTLADVVSLFVDKKTEQ